MMKNLPQPSTGAKTSYRSGGKKKSPNGARSVAQKTRLSLVFLQVPFLLVLLALIKIGNAPLFLIEQTLSCFKYLLTGIHNRKISKLLSTATQAFSLSFPRKWESILYKFALRTGRSINRTLRPSVFNLGMTKKRSYKKSVFSAIKIFFKNFRLNLKKHHRGRPRTKSLWNIYFHKTKRLILRLVPKKARVRIALLLILLSLVTYSSVIVKLVSQLPSPYQLTTSQRPLTTQIYDRKGNLLYQIYEGKNRKLIKLEELPPQLINATIAIEDKHFFTHPGVDPVGILRALNANLNEGRMEGGSTITQQLIKNTLLTPDQTLTRKVKEAFLAFWAERIYNKQEILQMYFNEAPYGGPAWGIETASEMYFGKNVHDLDLSESAFLAGLPAAPTEYSPYGTHPEKGKQRQQEVLKRMVEDGYISQKQMDEALKKELSFKPPIQDIRAPHFVMYVRSLLSSRYGERAVSQGGLKVVTTLDLDIQDMAEEVVSRQVTQLKDLKVGNGAAMVTDPRNGQILAMVGSKDYFSSDSGNFNVALALRQPGSSIKPITYATAFKEGMSPGTTLLDVPTTFPNPWGQSYSPVNYDGRFHGPVTIRTALGSSYNIPAVKALATTGVPALLSTAQDLGITTLTDTKNYGLSLTLGGGAVKMIEMMSAYGTFASGGVRFAPEAILTVVDPSGNVLEDHTQPEGRQVLTGEVAYLIANVLSDKQARMPAFGPNSGLEIVDHPTVAVKTGTSDDKRDNWAFGFTPEYVVGTWVGNNDYSPMDQKLTSGITGATPIWHDIMNNLLLNKKDLAFTRPAGIVEGVIDGHKDLTITGQITKTVVGFQKVKQKDESTGQEKEVISFTDQFSKYIPEPTKTTQ
jgi:1A family penicillin-binding protein